MLSIVLAEVGATNFFFVLTLIVMPAAYGWLVMSVWSTRSGRPIRSIARSPVALLTLIIIVGLLFTFDNSLGTIVRNVGGPRTESYVAGTRTYLEDTFFVVVYGALGAVGAWLVPKAHSSRGHLGRFLFWTATLPLHVWLALIASNWLPGDDGLILASWWVFLPTVVLALCYGPWAGPGWRGALPLWGRRSEAGARNG